MGNPLCWFEIGTRNLEKSRKFYNAVFNWEIKDNPDFPDMPMIETGATPGGGIFLTPPEVPLSLMAYFHVEDINTTLEKVKEAGGMVLKEKTDIPQIGFFAIIQDTEGIVSGLFEGLKK